MELPENGNNGGFRKYRRMDSNVEEDENENENVIKNKNNSSKYVMACAIFASLNSVLLGYVTFEVLRYPVRLKYGI
ncbi:hypothetical protein RD792_007825 [Penstemon davidsonii]|uniref:Uncharacterized protein n=1 Tax=Penstemon davidsonii TaxID=160366 RepID=A0ABR0D880_9LAMI|nr:hypothetical protein RD792_007825 [Penstemon davidsonii]